MCWQCAAHAHVPFAQSWYRCTGIPWAGMKALSKLGCYEALTKAMLTRNEVGRPRRWRMQWPLATTLTRQLMLRTGGLAMS